MVSPTVQNQARYRAPDAIQGGTWEAFERVLQRHNYYKTGLPKIEAATTVAGHIDPTRNRSRELPGLPRCACRGRFVSPHPSRIPRLGDGLRSAGTLWLSPIIGGYVNKRQTGPRALPAPAAGRRTYHLSTPWSPANFDVLRDARQAGEEDRRRRGAPVRRPPGNGVAATPADLDRVFYRTFGSIAPQAPGSAALEAGRGAGGRKPSVHLVDTETDDGIARFRRGPPPAGGGQSG